MFCPYCKAARPNNETPCPNCGAPSPMTTGQAPFAGNAGTMAWGGAGATGAAGVSFKEQWDQQQHVPQLSFDNQASSNPWRAPSGQLNNQANNGNPWRAPSGQLGNQGNQVNNASSNPWRSPSGQLNNQVNNASSNPWRSPSGQLGNQADTTGNNPWNTGQSGNPVNNASSNPWRSPSGQLSNQASPAQSWQQQAFDNQIPLPSWQQTDGLSPTTGQLQQNTQSDSTAQNQAGQQQSNLPALYEGEGGRQPTISLQLVPEQAISHLLPAEPLPAPDILRVEPMYTKPRPIIPKKRAVSGLVSVIIVTLLLCVGAGYTLNATGIWGNVVAFYNGKPVGNITAPAVKIPDPQAPVSGPAHNNIPSAALATRIDSNSQPIEQKYIFSPNQTFYITLSVQPDKGQKGTVTVKWYTNGNLFRSYPYTVAYKANYVTNLNAKMQFANPVSGKVELYWNGKLAETLFFAVR